MTKKNELAFGIVLLTCVAIVACPFALLIALL